MSKTLRHLQNCHLLTKGVCVVVQYWGTEMVVVNNPPIRVFQSECDLRFLSIYLGIFTLFLGSGVEKWIQAVSFQPIKILVFHNKQIKQTVCWMTVSIRSINKFWKLQMSSNEHIKCVNLSGREWKIWNYKPPTYLLDLQQSPNKST